MDQCLVWCYLDQDSSLLPSVMWGLQVLLELFHGKNQFWKAICLTFEKHMKELWSCWWSDVGTVVRTPCAPLILHSPAYMPCEQVLRVELLMNWHSWFGLDRVKVAALGENFEELCWALLLLINCFPWATVQAGLCLAFILLIPTSSCWLDLRYTSSEEEWPVGQRTWLSLSLPPWGLIWSTTFGPRVYVCIENMSGSRRGARGCSTSPKVEGVELV